MDEMEHAFFGEAPWFRTILNNMPHPVYCQDVQGYYLAYNRAFLKLFGEGLHESYVGKTVFDLPISPEERVSWHKADLDLYRSPGDRTHEQTLTFPDGSVRNVCLRRNTLCHADGKVAGIVGFMSDTPNSAIVKDERRSEAQFDKSSEASPDAILFVENGIITDANERTGRMFGLDRNLLVGRSLADFIASEPGSATERRVDSSGEERYETVGVRRDGTIFPIGVSTRPLDLDGKQIGVSVVRDLTEQKKMEEEILKSKNLQSVGTLAGGIAHDFNNLLMAIVGNISLARLHASEGSKTVDYLAEAERIVFMGKELTNQLLTFSNGVDAVKKHIDIAPLVKETAEEIFRGSFIKPHYTIADDLFLVEVDENQIRRVIRNIISNAKEAMPGGGTISITCENANITMQHKLPLPKGKYVRILIQDEGVGISRENLSKIFDPYFTTKDMGPKKGVGLGLAISYSIIRRHNGYIYVDSAPDKGATFQIYLPAYKQPVSLASARKEVLARGKGRVLVLDDEKLVLEIAEELLRYMGYEVTTTQTGEEAVFLYREAMGSDASYDAVILDLAIEDGMGGAEVMENLKAMDPRVRAIISSGYLHDPVITHFEDYGFAGTLTKPYNPEELDQKLAAVIGGAA
ncbi:MAG TPA: PAS domain S-box protein [Syntrophorhabdaceae bacterium]|nr:PAS domain S-box protein [Syntrophorhabdaceae bacterium]